MQLTTADARSVAGHGRSGRGAPLRRDSAYVLLILYAALVPLLVVRAGGGVTLGAVDALFPFALVVLLQQMPARATAPSIFASIFLFAAGISTVAVLLEATPSPVNVEVSQVLLILRVVEIYAVFFVALGWKGWDRERARRLTLVTMSSGMIACIIGILLHHAGIQVRATQQVNWYGEGLGSSLRAGGLLGNSGDYGHIAAILGACAITLGVVYHIKPAFIMACLLIAGYATFLSSSRAAILHLLVAIVCMLPALLRGKRALSIITTTLGALIAVGFYLATSGIDARLAVTLRRLDVLNITGESSFYTSATRVSTWDQVADLIAQNPFTGIGYGMMVPRVGNAGDNSFLTVLTELGLLAGLAYMALWASAAVTGMRTPAGPARSAAVALIASEAAHMLTVDTHSMWATTPVSLLLVALVLRECAAVRLAARKVSSPKTRLRQA